jgi:hypothetical protein
MKHFLSGEQFATLKNNNWDVKPDGMYVHLYRDEYNEDLWELICYQAEVDADIDKLTLLVFGTMTNL